MRHRIMSDNAEGLIKAFTPDHRRERPPSDVWKDCAKNWWQLPFDLRMRCVGHLHAEMLKTDYGRELLARWKDQVERGMEPGSDDLRFHFGNGMTVRNVLRSVLPDDKLPPIAYDGHVAQNWDDFYPGAVEQLATYGTADVHQPPARTCVTCRHAQPTEHSIMCGHLETLLRDPVRGSQRQLCIAVRADGGKCGPEGAYWQEPEEESWGAWALRWLLVGIILAALASVFVR